MIKISKKATTIAIVNQKGGTGKTTTCENLGIGLAMEGKKVLLVDADPQGSLTISMGWQQPDELPTTLSTLMQKAMNDQSIPPGEGILHHAEGVDLIPANIELAGLEVSLVNCMNREKMLKQVLEGAKHDYDFILLDCTPSLGMLTVNALAAADTTLIPVQAQYLSAKGLEQLLQTVQKVRRQINPKLKIEGILLTMTDSRTNYGQQIDNLIRGAYGSKIKVFDQTIPRSVRAAEISGSEPYLINEDDDREYRVEAYDISNLNGLDMVGAMVVYEGRRPIRKDYRKFRIKTADAGDDYGSLQEVIYRRLKRGKGGDPGFDHFPDIFFIDGGLGQVHAVKKIVDAFRMSIPVVGLAKDDVHRTRAIVFEDGSEYDLKGDSMLFSYAGTIQEEVHRFAITFQKDRRGKRMIESGLEKIPGVGPKRRQALLSHFRSVDAIKKASYDQLMEVDGMNSKAAESVLRYFSGQSTAGRVPEKGPRLH